MHVCAHVHTTHTDADTGSRCQALDKFVGGIKPITHERALSDAECPGDHLYAGQLSPVKRPTSLEMGVPSQLVEPVSPVVPNRGCT